MISLAFLNILRDKKSLVTVGILKSLPQFFNQMICAFAYNMNQLSQLWKALELVNDHGFVVSMSIPTLVAPVVASISVPEIWSPAMVTTREVILAPKLLLDQLNDNVVNLSTRGTSHSPFPAKRVRSDHTSIPIGEGSPKLDRLVEGGDPDTQSPFF